MDGMSVQEAADYLGINEKTVRRRIQMGEIAAVKVARRQGYIWRVYPGGLPADAPVEAIQGPFVQVDTHPAHMDSPSMDVDSYPDQVDLSEMVHLVERLSRENQQLAGQLGFTQAKLQEAERTVALLMAPTDKPVPDLPAEPERRPWWKRVWGG